MKRIFFDSSFFLNFYQSDVKEMKADSLTILDKLSKHKDLLIFPSQVYDEFQRNRVNLLQKLKVKFENSVNNFPYTTSIIRHFEDFNKIISTKKNIQANAKNIVKKIEKIIQNENEDPIYNKFISIYGDDKVKKIEANDNIFKKAHMRKLLGNPPSSDDKITIGDEVIWESILSDVKDDLIIVTRDTTYKNNFYFLKDEFKRITYKDLILVTEYSYKALEEIGEKVPDKLIELENKHVASTMSSEMPSGVIALSSNRGFSSAFDNNFFITPGSTSYLLERVCPLCSFKGVWTGENCPNCGNNFNLV